METLNSNMESENQFNQHEAESVKRKPLPKTNGPQFTIPRLKKIKRDLLTELPVSAHECQQEILTVLRNSFHFQFSALCHTFNRVQSVHNPDLTAKYLERKRDMKSNGYPDALVTDTYAFLPVDSPSAVDKLCRDGVRCGNQQFSGLGVSHMAVHACKHADILTPVKPKCGDKILLMVKILKGKVKAVLCKNVGAQLEPTPNYDCHIAKPNVDQAVLQPPHMLFYSSQLYVYEYGDFTVEDYPRQVLPYAIVYYTIREPHVPVPKNISSLPHPTQVASALPHKGPSTVLSSSTSVTSSSPSPDSGPNNEVWRGRLHVQLVEGGHIYIEVVMLSYFVPLTISLISPIKVHSLYPEHNAQFTFFCGLTNIACKDEVEWRAHYIRSCVMRPRPNNEEHFKALIKHISVKKEMPTVRLPHDVFLFLMPDCLLASQLGLVRRDDESPVLHCVIMSKYSTSHAQTKRLMEKNIALNNYGSATSWESLFDDSDLSDEEEQVEQQTARRHIRKSMATTFHEQRYVHNKFAAMSLADAEINFSPCACKKLSSKTNLQRYRDDDISRVYNSMQSANQSSLNRNSCFPPGSRHRPKQKLSRRAKAMPSFSPHGSSDSDTDNALGFPNSKQDQYSLLNNTKTVEEELSEEEITNEQMEDIIFLRKPVLSASSLTLSKQLSLPASSSYVSKPPKQPRLNSTVQALKPSYSSSDLKGFNKPTPLSSKPKLIPTEPLQPAIETSVPKPKTVPVKPKGNPREPANTEQLHPAIEQPVHKPKIIPVKPKVVPSEPMDTTAEVNNCKGNETPPLSSPSKSKPSDAADKSTPKKPPKSILKSSTKTSLTTEQPFPVDNNHTLPNIPPPIVPIPLQQNDFGDVDMRVPNQHSTSLHPVFLSAVQTSPQKSSIAPILRQQFSPNLSFGSWLAPSDIQPPSPLLSQHSSPFKLPVTPTSPPTKSPLSPTYSPASPPIDSPASPLSPPAGLDSESPASPPQSVFTEELRSSPVAIPTSRIQQNDTPEAYNVPFIPLQTSVRSSTRERIDNADDMKNFLNSGFDSDLDSSYEDER